MLQLPGFVVLQHLELRAPIGRAVGIANLAAIRRAKLEPTARVDADSVNVLAPDELEPQYAPVRRADILLKDDRSVKGVVPEFGNDRLQFVGVPDEPDPRPLSAAVGLKDEGSVPLRGSIAQGIDTGSSHTARHQQPMLLQSDGLFDLAHF